MELVHTLFPGRVISRVGTREHKPNIVKEQIPKGMIPGIDSFFEE